MVPPTIWTVNHSLSIVQGRQALVIKSRNPVIYPSEFLVIYCLLVICYLLFHIYNININNMGCAVSKPKNKDKNVKLYDAKIQQMVSVPVMYDPHINPIV